MYKIYINYLFYFYCSVFFILFVHPDLVHTSIASNTLFSTSLSNFYDLNKSIIGESSYFPLLYLLFSIWHLPLKILGIDLFDINNPDINNILIFGSNSNILFIYDKLFILFVFFIAHQSFNRILKSFNLKDTFKLFSFSSPFIFFAILLFGGYDIVLLLFTLIAFECYLKNYPIRFCIFSVLAVSLKFYALPFLAFLAIKFIRKSFQRFCFGVIVALVIFIAQFYPFLGNESFLYSITNLFLYKASVPLLPFSPSTIVLLIYISLFTFCILNKNLYEFLFMNNKNFIVCIFLINFLLFASTPWSPQWLIYLTPFTYLLSIFFKFEKFQSLVDFLLALIFIILIISIWPFNIDSNMLHFGLLKYFDTLNFISLSSFIFIPYFLNNQFNINFIALYLSFYLLLFMPILVVFIKFNFFKNLNIINFSMIRVLPFSLFLIVPIFKQSEVSHMYVLSDYKDQKMYLENSIVCQYFDNQFSNITELAITVPNPSTFVKNTENYSLKNQYGSSDNLTVDRTINKSVFFKINPLFNKDDSLKLCFAINQDYIYTSYNRKKYYKSNLSVNNQYYNQDLPIKIFYNLVLH